MDTVNLGDLSQNEAIFLVSAMSLVEATLQRDLKSLVKIIDTFKLLRKLTPDEYESVCLKIDNLANFIKAH